MPQVKVLQIVWNFPATVAQPFDMYYFYWPVREAVLRGWQAEVLTFQVHAHQAEREIIDGILVHRCPPGMGGNKLLSWSFLSALLTTDAHIIYCHGYGEGQSELSIMLGRLRSRKVIFAPYFHVYPFRRPWRELYDRTLGRLFLHYAHKVIVSTEYTAQVLSQLGIARKHVEVIPHVARPEVFAPRPAEKPAGHLLREAGVTGWPLILGVGQLIERKGWEHTLRCLPTLLAHFPHARLLLIGSSRPADPAFRARFTQLATQLGVLHAIQILQDNSADFIRDAYRSATLLTHPSSVESFGLVLLEAMTAGIPVVAHTGTGLPCIVDDGVTGYVVDVHDTRAYTGALLRLLNDPDLRHRLGEAGRQQAMTRFSQTKAATQLFTIFTTTLGVTMPVQQEEQVQNHMLSIPGPPEGL